ncbi:MFS transporter [Variovorax sp. J2P1-59]|uniref:MFS transporter n=1 Tax=Variovorax flavidus TaxID=3053501 RepID=UPI0025750AC7|nr:MFS transporter [Variovorax sp. J2P1-59]MDM0078638.1 MFS transporter [Variovorax sp. J2P1-59]
MSSREPQVLEPPPRWEPHEKPSMPGSPATLAHSLPRRVAYALVAVLVGLTGGLGAALVTANLSTIQGELGLTPVQGAWLPAAYVMANVTVNLLVFKFRQQYGIRLFAEMGLGVYAALTLMHLLVHNFEMALLVRAASGFAAATTATLAVQYMQQVFPRTKAGAGLVVGLTLSQLATPLAWLMSPSLLDLGDWRTLYALEAGLALCSFAAVVVLKLPVGLRIRVLETRDFLTFALVAPGVALLAAVLSQGLNVWWIDTPWLAWALIGAIGLLTCAAIVEYRREYPLLQIRWLLNGATLRFIFGALMMRFLMSEQTYGAVGLLRTLGMGPDQLQPLYGVMLVGMICGLTFTAFFFGQKSSQVFHILGAIVLIAIGGWMDRHATSDVRPHDFFVSQFMISFAAAMFMGPLMLIGVGQALKHGTDHMVTFIVLFSVTQTLGGLTGAAVLGTLQAQRTTLYSQAISAQMQRTDASVIQRINHESQSLAHIITDPVQRTAQGTAQLAQIVRREASVRAFNYVFTVIGVLALAFLSWSLYRAIIILKADRPPSGISAAAAAGARAPVGAASRVS